MTLAIDQGNTYTKAGIFENDDLMKVFHISEEELPERINQIAPRNCIICSVKGNSFDLERVDPDIPIIMLDPSTPIPATNLYATPDTLGMDRLAGVIGSLRYKPSGNNLVIDCGTCITYDFIDLQKQYIGGSISPGMDMRFKSLNTFTANLPLIEFEEPVELIGKSTKASILSGVVNGILVEIEGVINKYSETVDNLSVFLCGGGAKYFDGKIRGAIFVRPELALYGLNEIVKHNVKNK